MNIPSEIEKARMDNPASAKSPLLHVLWKGSVCPVMAITSGA